MPRGYTIEEIKRINSGMQCPECYGINITRQESRFSGTSEDRFSCRSCGAQWGSDHIHGEG